MNRKRRIDARRECGLRELCQLVALPADCTLSSAHAGERLWQSCRVGRHTVWRRREFNEGGGLSRPLLPPHTGLDRIGSPANLIDKARKTRVFLIQASDNRLLSDRAIAHHGGLGAAIYVDGD